MGVILGILGIIGLLIIILNWYTRYFAWVVIPKMSQEERDQRLGEPFIPIIGGLFVYLALHFLGAPIYLKILPFIVDYGCFLGTVSFIIGMFMNIFDKPTK
ncbi:MAG: hypothetical protein FWH20_06645 [Oscillospiraceae bacterium]|nr:hypothetical protein [Oscillospiraceae bacterium]